MIRRFSLLIALAALALPPAPDRLPATISPSRARMLMLPPALATVRVLRPRPWVRVIVAVVPETSSWAPFSITT